jgi:hypothetical protein
MKPEDIIGKIQLPTGYQSAFGSGGSPGGLVMLFTNILRLVFVVAGLYAFINFIVAGFQYMGAAGDSKALSAAWDRIWQSFIGLIVIVASFALAALAGQILFGNPGFILNPKIYGPGQ